MLGIGVAYSRPVRGLSFASEVSFDLHREHSDSVDLLDGRQYGAVGGGRRCTWRHQWLVVFVGHSARVLALLARAARQDNRYDLLGSTA